MLSDEMIMTCVMSAIHAQNAPNPRKAMEAAIRLAVAETVEACAGSLAARDVLLERSRQQVTKGWTPDHDDQHDEGEMAAAASAYAIAAADLLYPTSQGDGNFDSENPPSMWPPNWLWKPGEPRRMLVKSAALLLAEIERLDRAAIREKARTK